MPPTSPHDPARPRRRRPGARRSAVAGLVVAAILGPLAAPIPAGAAPSKPPSIKELQAERARIRANAAKKASEVDVLKASDDELTQALSALARDVATQEAMLQDAETARVQAEADVAAADAALAQSEAELASLESNIRNEAIDAFVNAPRDDEWTVFAGGDPNDALTRRTYLQMRSTKSQDSAEAYRAIQEDLAIQRKAKSDAAANAAQKKAAAESQLSNLQSSQDQQEAMQAEVDARIDRALAEADSLAQLDGQLSAEISDRQAKLAAQIEAARKAAASRRSTSSRPRSGGSVPSNLITDGAGIVNVDGISVHSSIAENLRAMLAAARADGVNLSGGGYRNPAAQIAVRRNNCGSSNYAIYQAPSSSCRPPTAPPGTSQHERGLAIDFSEGGRTLNRSSAGFAWLKANAANYGFYNLPSEPWHWSTTGN